MPETHRGFARLHLEEANGRVETLRGGYFTGRGRETYGEIELFREIG